MLQPWFGSCPCFPFYLPHLPQSERQNIHYVFTGTQETGAAFGEKGFVLEEVLIRKGLGSMLTGPACLFTSTV